MVHIVAVNDQVADRSGGVGAVDSNPKAVGPAARTQLAIGVLLDVMHLVMKDFDVGTAPEYADSARDAAIVAGPIVAYLEALHAHKAHIGQLHHAAFAFRRRQASAVENRVLTRLTLKRDEPLLRVPRDLDCQLLAVAARPNINRVPRLGDVGCMLDGAQGILDCPRI